MNTPRPLLLPAANALSAIIRVVCLVIAALLGSFPFFAGILMQLCFSRRRLPLWLAPGFAVIVFASEWAVFPDLALTLLGGWTPLWTMAWVTFFFAFGLSEMQDFQKRRTRLGSLGDS